jgi:hypothetical protein
MGAFEMKAIYKLVTISKEGVTKTFCNLNDYTSFIDDAHIAEGYNLDGSVVFSKNTDSLLYTLYKKATNSNKPSILKNSKFLIKLEKVVMDGEELNIKVSDVQTWGRFKTYEELEKKFEFLIEKYFLDQNKYLH